MASEAEMTRVALGALATAPYLAPMEPMAPRIRVESGAPSALDSLEAAVAAGATSAAAAAALELETRAAGAVAAAARRSLRPARPMSCMNKG